MSTKANAVLMLCIGGFFYLAGVSQWDSNSTPLFSAKKACAEHLWPERLLCALHMLFIVWYPPERSAPHLLQDLCDLCAGIAILPQCGADAGIALALAAHQHGHVGHRHIPGGVTAQTGGSARAAVGCTGGRTARASAASLTACRRAASAACFLRCIGLFQVPLAQCDVQLLACDIVVEFLLVEFVLILPLARLVLVALLVQAVLILTLLQLLVPLSVRTVCLVLTVAGLLCVEFTLAPVTEWFMQMGWIATL